MTGPDDPYGGDAFDDDALAAEYVLHLLDAEARAAFEARLTGDRDLQALVWQWEARLAPLADEIADTAPPARLRARVLASVQVPDAPRSQRRLARSWRWALGGVAVAAVLAFVVFGDVLRGPGDLSPAFQAELTTADGSLVLVAGVIPATHEIVIERLAGAPPEGRVHQLWLIAEGADAPVSLGLLEADGSTRIRVPDEIAPGVRTGTIAVSDEPPGGSPTGAPTGTVLATATFTDL